MGVKVLWDHHVVSELLGLGDLVSTVEKIETTTHDSDCQTFIAGRSAFSDLTMDCYFDASESQWNLIKAISSRRAGLWQIVSPPDVGPHAIEFRGFVSERKLKYPLKGEASTWSLSVTPVEVPRECTQRPVPLKTLAIAVGDDHDKPGYTASTSSDGVVAASHHVVDLGPHMDAKMGSPLTVICETVEDVPAIVYINGAAAAKGAVTLKSVRPTEILYAVVQPVDSSKATPAIYTVSLVGGA
jgi:hypothetical protein